MGRSRFPRASHLPRNPWQAAVVVVILALIGALQQWRAQSPQQPAIAPATYHVARVVDGDTLRLAEFREKVRLIGVDTPETVKPNWPVEPWGPEASQFTKKFVVGGVVRLEFDGPPRDKYGRILAYVWVDGQMLNEELLRAGLARAEMQYDYSAKMKSCFRRAETEARAAHRGIWSGKNGDN